MNKRVFFKYKLGTAILATTLFMGGSNALGPLSIVGEAVAQPSASRDGQTRGESLNNPGLINMGERFHGEVVSSDSRFAQFATPHDGIRAMALNLRNYQNIHNINTVNDIITRYAPPSDNNPAVASGDYQRAVAKHLGVGVNDKIDLNNPETLAKLTESIITFENGRNIYSEDQIRAAVEDSYNNKPKADIPDTRPSIENQYGLADGVAIPNYTAEQLAAAGCDATVWQAMLSQYTHEVERHMELATEVQVTNQVALSPELPASCYSQIINVVNDIKSGMNLITGILTGSGFNPDRITDYVVTVLAEEGMNQVCSAFESVLNETGVGQAVNQGLNVMTGGLSEIKKAGVQVGNSSINMGDIIDESGFKPGNSSTNPYYQDRGTTKDEVKGAVGGVVNPNLIPGGGFGGGQPQQGGDKSGGGIIGSLKDFFK